MKHDYKENKGDDGLMQYNLRASWPPIQCEVVDDNMIGCYYYEKKGDDGLMWHAHRASQPLIRCEDVANILMKC
eukprot:12273720-Ditylum_brightwellii.AAC.1